MNRLIDLIIDKYKIVLVLVCLMSIPFAYCYLNQEIFNHIDVFFEKDDPDLQFYKRFQKTYGNEESGVIVFKDENIFTRENIELIRRISEMAGETKGVQRVISLTEATISVSSQESVDFKKIIPDGELTEQALKAVREKALSHNVLTQSLISKDGTTTALMLELKPISSNEDKGEVLRHLKDSANRIAGERVQLHFTGPPYVEVEINTLTKKDNRRFAPITVILILFIVAFLLKKISLSILTQLNIYLIGMWGIGFLTLCGESMNMVTVVIPPILLAISVADSIHILAHYKELYYSTQMDHRSAVSQAVKSLWLPCLFTSLTTGIGFISFVTTSVRPVKTVGIFTSIGVMFAFIITVSFLPAALMLFQKRLERDKPSEHEKQEVERARADLALQDGMQNGEGKFAKLLCLIGNFTVNNYKAIGMFTVIIMVISIMGMFRLRYETNFVNYLPDDNNIKKDITFVENNLGGSVPVILLIQSKTEEFDFTHPRSLKLLEEIQDDTMRLMEGRYTLAFSLADYFKEINMAFKDGRKDEYKIPDNRIDILDFYELGDVDDLSRIVSLDRMEARISFLAELSSSADAIKSSEMIGKVIKEKLGDNYSFKQTGSGPLYTVMDENLKESQVRSFFSALVLIFIMMFFVCKSTKLTIISMVPNLFPIILTLGIMGWLNIPLDVSTVMIASVTIGIAVDDTIHFLVWFKRNVMSGIDIKGSVLKTYKDTGKPIVITSLVLCMSYLVLITGSVKPIIAFGVLASLSMFFALIGDLFVLPSIILLFKPQVKK